MKKLLLSNSYKNSSVISVLDQFYSIPEPSHQGLAATESIYRISNKEVIMESTETAIKKIRCQLHRFYRFSMLMLLVIQIGLSCFQTRVSGKVDQQI